MIKFNLIEWVKALKSMSPRRSIELVTDYSDLATRLCSGLLEPAAEFFAPDGKFASSDLPELTRVLPFTSPDMFALNTFTAVKLETPDELVDGEESVVSFHISIQCARPYEPPMYWPGLTGRPMAAGDIIIDDARMRELTMADPVAPPKNGIVFEVWDYDIDNEYNEPRVHRRWEYFEDEHATQPLAIVNAHDAETMANITLSADDEQEAILRAMDIELTESFSEYDVRIIAGVLRNMGFDNGFTLQEDAA